MQKLIVFTCLLLAVLAKDLYQCPKDLHFGMQCTMEYEPVCGYSANGLRYFTYSNGCVACVSGAFEYTKGGCEDNQLMGKIPAVERMMQKFSGFNAPAIQQQQQQQQKQSFCIGERPEMCTMEYEPVCGYFNKCNSQNIEDCRSTFGNGCQACARGADYSVKGACGQEDTTM